MNIQIFGLAKSFDTKKAPRYFSERGIKAQYIDLKIKQMSRGELQSVLTAVGGYSNLVDGECRNRELLTLFNYLTDDSKFDNLLENQALLKLPIVRNGRLATVGFAPEVWKGWE